MSIRLLAVGMVGTAATFNHQAHAVYKLNLLGADLWSVHELLHLKVPNHGKLFKSLLRAYLPNYNIDSY